jgi:hypothetical protein
VPLGVYSTRLYAGWFGGALDVKGLLFTVPAGHRAILRDASSNQAHGTGAYTELYLGSGGPLLARYVPSADNYWHITGQHIVFHEGESCYGLQHLTGAMGQLSGYLLVGSGGPLTVASLPAP